MSIQNLAGQTLGQYELRELLGEGGMGAVYRAYQRTLDREVAVKVLPASLAGQSGYMERFTREARTAAALEHQNIVPVYDYGTQGGISFVVMRQLTGGTLADRLAHSVEEHRPLPSLQETAQITRQLASALDYAHSKGVIHRDIKANNIMFDSQGTPFIVDFGIAKLLNATSALTGTGVAMGTPSYMAPEQWRGAEIGPAADQYALAVLVFAMLTGKMPFEADSPYQLMHKHMFDEPTPIHNYRADLPEAVQPIFDRAFAKEPSARFSNTTAFAKALDEAVQGITSQQPTGFFLTPLPIRRLNIPLQSTPVDGPTFTPPDLNMAGAFQSTVPDIPMDKAPTPTSSSITSGTPPTVPPQPPTPPSSSRNWLPIAGLGLVAAIIIMVGIILVMQNGQQDDNKQSGDVPTRTAEATLDPFIVAQGLLTATAQAQTPADATQTIEAVLTQLAQATTDGGTAVAVNQGTDVSTETTPASPTATATVNSSPTATRTNTPNAVETLEARATINSEQTSAAQGGQATEATNTPSPTITLFPSATPSPTATAQPSNSPSPQATATSTATASPTFDVEATTNAAATQTAESAVGTHQAATQNAVETLASHATADAKSTQAAATSAAAPTQTAQAIAAAIQIGQTTREVNVRSEPGTTGDILATLRQGTRVVILGANEDGSWFNVELTDGTTGWIRSDLLTVLGPPTPTPTPSSTPEIQEFDNVAMVFVPAGCFTMGSDEAQLALAVSAGTSQDIANAETPTQEICFDTPFWIDQYEVTNAQFDSLGGQAAKGAVTTDPNAPREQVSWVEAKAYCEMRGGRLPTEAEWEYAARGPANLIYPWGNEFEPDDVTFLGNSRSQAQPVGSHPDGVSWVGAYDMSGNVWEWTNSIFAAYPYDAADGREGDGDGNRIVRGGSYQDNDEFLRTSMRAFWIPPNDGYASIGFRCVLDYEERG